MKCLVRIALLFALIGVVSPAFSEEKAQEEKKEEKAPAGPTDISQVQVQVWISETTEEGLRDIGSELSFTRFVRQEEQTGSVQQVRTNMTGVTSFGEVRLPNPDAPPGTQYDPSLNNVRSPRTREEGFGLTYNIIDPGYGMIDGVFRAMETRSDFDFISKPELLVVNTGVAQIHAGSQVPYQTVAYPKGQPVLSVAWRDVGVKLKLQPTILPDDLVQLHVQELSVSDSSTVDVRGLDLPVFSTRSQTGIVLVPAYHRLLHLPIHRAVGTSSATIVLISAAGMASYAALGWRADVPATALGYVDARALLLALPALGTARLGVWTAHRLPTRPLRLLFAALAAFVALRMLYGALLA